MYNFKIEEINLDKAERPKVEEFLSAFDLFLDEDVEYTIVLKNKDEILGTCSCDGKVLKCFAVNKNYQGEGIASRLITHMTNYLFDKGIFETFVFSKPNNTCVFRGLGYRDVYSTDEVVLLEGGTAYVRKYVKEMFEKSGLGDSPKAAIVMNCNPFTLGHRYLIESAAKENEEVIVFVVEEDRSLFPFDVRLNLVKKGTEDLKNVYVIPGGDYIVSSATFPSYFLRDEDIRFSAYMKLDLGIFSKYIAPVFNISKRYVGTEPFCKVTNNYNNNLKEILTKDGIAVKELPRLEYEGKTVSASEVRRLIKMEKWQEVKKLVPEITYSFLVSGKADKIIEKIKRSDSPH
ncbi:[citrate (pro-3S)-lyase] ligase [Wukongibacter baidiensis]|uniref:[citrate (pro-3S)-lyase] ligase n=1 Tax=Wukongibacter baidiensis TaxID=1723361 RepID=UPI003D7FC240